MDDQPTIAGNGLNMPALGFGTFELDTETVMRMVPEVLELGYRHIDTAQVYRNEAAVGRALAATGVPRGELFVTTKVWVDRYQPAELRASVSASLERLQTDYLDLLLLHWPVFGDRGMNPTLEALMLEKSEGRAKNIGISNFSIEQTEQAVAFCGQGTLATNQVEFHVFLGQQRLRRVLSRNDLVLTAYMPLAKGRAAADPVLAEIGRRYGKSAAQVALKWLVEQDRVSAIPATSNPQHARANIEIFDFALDEADRSTIAVLGKRRRLCKPAGLSPVWDD